MLIPLIIGALGDIAEKLCFIILLFFILPVSAFANTDHLILVNLTTNQLSFLKMEIIQKHFQ